MVWAEGWDSLGGLWNRRHGLNEGKILEGIWKGILKISELNFSISPVNPEEFSGPGPGLLAMTGTGLGTGLEVKIRVPSRDVPGRSRPVTVSSKNREISTTIRFLVPLIGPKGPFELLRIIFPCTWHSFGVK